MYYAITVLDGIITGVHESGYPITQGILSRSAYAGHDVVSVPHGDISDGLSVASYDDSWTLRPLSQRVGDGLVTVDEGYVLDGEEIRPMTPQERIDAGLDPAPDTPEPIDETQLRIMQIKAELAETDYRVIKCYEYSLAGTAAPYNIAELHAERQALRDEINTLEEQ